jgi:hypothetical protein
VERKYTTFSEYGQNATRSPGSARRRGDSWFLPMIEALSNRRPLRRVVDPRPPKLETVHVRPTPIICRQRDSQPWNFK